MSTSTRGATPLNVANHSTGSRDTVEIGTQTSPTLLERGSLIDTTRSSYVTRFKAAFGKALKVMSKRLGRLLNRKEWIRLRDAVKKQISRKTVSSTNKQMSWLNQRLSVIEGAIPQTFKETQERVLLLADQLQILRRQMLDVTAEREDDLREICPHFWRKKKVYLQSEDAISFGRSHVELDNRYLSFGDFPLKTDIVCDACCDSRERFLLLRHGLSLPKLSDIAESFQAEQLERFVQLNGLDNVHPLAIQAIWSRLLDLLYDRNS